MGEQKAALLFPFVLKNYGNAYLDVKGGTLCMSKKGRMQRLAGLLELPQDIVLDLPRITMLGNIQMLVENHKGIIEYTPELVRIRLKQGELVINGSDLVLGNLQAEQILVEGTMSEIRYNP
jgi:sporulation protein YqfC